jgi:HK97 family phage major capsid protein
MSESFIKQLKEQRANAWEQAKALLDGAAEAKRDLSAEENATYEAINADLDALDKRAKDIADAEQRNKDAAETFARIEARTPEREVPAAKSANEQLRAVLRGEARAVEIAPEQRDLVKSSATAAGNIVPTSFYGKLWEHMIEVSGLLSANPTVLRTASGENFEVPVTTSHSTAALIAEAATLTESDPAVAKRTLGAYKYGMSLQVSRELVEDSGVDLEGYLAHQAGRAVGNAFGVDLMTGNASSKPSGVVQTASTGVTGAASVAGVFTADDLIDLYYSVISPYRNSPSCGWLMRDATIARARKLKGSDNNYLWQPGLTVAQPDTLLGKPVHSDPNVAATALSAKSVIFGDLAAYIVRIAGGVRFERSDDFAFQNDLITYRCVLRGDGILADQSGAVKVFVGNAA